LRQRDAGGHCLALEKGRVGSGRESNQNRGLEIIRRSQPRRLNLRLLGLFPIVVSRDERAGVIEQKKGGISKGAGTPKEASDGPT